MQHAVRLLKLVISSIGLKAKRDLTFVISMLDSSSLIADTDDITADSARKVHVAPVAREAIPSVAVSQIEAAEDDRLEESSQVSWKCCMITCGMWN